MKLGVEQAQAQRPGFLLATMAVAALLLYIYRPAAFPWPMVHYWLWAPGAWVALAAMAVAFVLSAPGLDGRHIEEDK